MYFFIFASCEHARFLDAYFILQFYIIFSSDDFV